ncbi:hypothetical protein BDY17DRAFT_182793 [Neohortaea acidophila]|uniref:Uncharacterized protein n=1 Tax=Neohortaea acidophila TaxID=245834 RepID=A0A6A6PM30_9PEZI|nr:uncharacterized protein BDY17DRAFT_182793 [Neohortaea acidophila]KAF2481099.1 hypothetical protein BDY17DRAFT_182793 [Neohortaea acidophila]
MQAVKLNRTSNALNSLYCSVHSAMKNTMQADDECSEESTRSRGQMEMSRAAAFHHPAVHPSSTTSVSNHPVPLAKTDTGMPRTCLV